MEKEIEFLKQSGYEVEDMTPYQFRINRTLDLYPKRRRFHNLETQERGSYPLNQKELKEFVDRNLQSGRPHKKAQEKTLPPGRYYEESMAPWWAKAGKGK